MKEILWNHIQTVKQTAPLVHNITNFVVMNNTANALLAVGASPIMAHAHSEIKELLNIVQSLVINIGTLDDYWIESMYLATQTAHQLNKPWILDPVGAGASSLRNTVVQNLLKNKPTVVRGNASEIASIVQQSSTSKGVDSTLESTEIIDIAKHLAHELSAVVCVSGAKDIITDGNVVFYVENGHPLMTKVTGLGCSATAIIGAFIAVIDNKLEATVAAMCWLGLAGELAEKMSNGPGSLQSNLLDKLYSINKDEFFEHLKIYQA